tara:strand:+ start:423 stop:650 length:228 start_codon:yes stop_codon:yes gene_type:complete
MTPQQHVETVLKRCLDVYPPKGKNHKKFFKRLVKHGSIPEELATMITQIIEDPECVYTVKDDGTLIIMNNTVDSE